MNYAPRARFTLETTRYGLLLLLAVYVVQTVAVTPLNWTILAIGVLPIVFMLRPVWRGVPMAHAWLCFMLLMYFLIAVKNMFSPSRQLLDVVRLILVIIIFLSSMMYVRWGSRARRAAVQQNDASTVLEDVVND